MAGPHVAGAAALVMSAVPQLQRQPALVRQFLINAATPVSSTSYVRPQRRAEQPVWGSGRLDVHSLPSTPRWRGWCSRCSPTISNDRKWCQ
jgi:hypothetical protein